MSLRDDEVYCVVAPSGMPRTWTIAKTIKGVKTKISANVSSSDHESTWGKWKAKGFTIQKMRLILVGD